MGAATVIRLRSRGDVDAIGSEVAPIWNVRPPVIMSTFAVADELVPHRRPASSCGIDLYGHRSLPQIAARVTRTSASVGSISRASGASSTRTSPAPYITVAHMSGCLRSEEEAGQARHRSFSAAATSRVSHDRTGTPDLTDPAMGLPAVPLTDD